MYIKPLDGETDLAGIHGSGGEQIWRDILRIHVIEANLCIVATKPQRQPLQRLGGTCHYLLARRGRASECHLRDIGMARQSLSKGVLIDSDVDDARRQYFRTECAKG